MKYKCLTFVILIAFLISFSACNKEAPKTEGDKDKTKTDMTTKVNTDDIVAKISKFRADVEGKLTIHNETKNILAKGTFEVKQDKLLGNAKFNLVVADYKIKIPNTVVNNIGKTVEVTVELTMDKLNK